MYFLLPCIRQEFDTIARLETQAIDAYNEAHLAFLTRRAQEGPKRYSKNIARYDKSIPNMYIHIYI